MFIGPFSVYLGGLLGPRRILLFAAGVFTVTCAFLPLIHSYSLLVAALIVAGLTSGTFYPLTLTFALRNIPLRFLPFTIALYATFCRRGRQYCAVTLRLVPRSSFLALDVLEFSSDCAGDDDLYLFRDTCSPARKKDGPVPSFVGFLYLSAGLAMLFIAIQQGERLDWWRSGVFNGVVLVGSFFLYARSCGDYCGPNPLVALPYLWQWNTVLLGILLFWFRFTLTGTIILIPQSLAIHGFEADQIGPAVIWSAAPLLLVAFIAALLLLRKLDPRLLMAVGFTCMAFACCLNAEYTTAWSAANYYRTELLMGVGQAFAFIGVVGCIVLQGIFSGGLAKPQRILTFSAFFHTIRLFGGTTGAIYMGHFVADREKLHSNLLGSARDSGKLDYRRKSSGLGCGRLQPNHPAWLRRERRAVDLIAARLRLQAYALSLIDGFLLVAWACVLGLLLTALLRKSPLNYGDLSAIQQHLRAPQETKS